MNWSQIVKERETKYNNYMVAVERWCRVGTKNGKWPSQKEKHWEVICSVLKGREILYKEALYELKNISEKR